MQNYSISPSAVKARYAAELRFRCGRHAALRYVERHGISVRLYRLASQLLAIERHEMHRERLASQGIIN